SGLLPQPLAEPDELHLELAAELGMEDRDRVDELHGLLVLPGVVIRQRQRGFNGSWASAVPGPFSGSAGPVLMRERAAAGTRPAVGRVGSHDGRVGARASPGIPGPYSVLSRAGPCRPNPAIRPGWRGMPANGTRAFGPTSIGPL